MNVEEFYSRIGGSYLEAKTRLANDALILRFLLKYKENGDYKQCIEAYEKKDFHAVFEASHALKGVAGNLALTPLFTVASKITEATRHLQEGEVPNIEIDVKELIRVQSLIEEELNKLS